MGNYTSVMMTAGIGNRAALHAFAETWGRVHGGEIALSSNDAVLFLERKNFDEELLLHEIQSAAWDHPEWMQVWFWREGDGEWVEMNWREGSWESVCGETAYSIDMAKRILLKVSDCIELDQDEREYLDTLRTEREAARKKQAYEDQWRREWKDVIERQAQLFMKESA